MMLAIPQMLTPDQVAALRADLLGAEDAWVDASNIAVSVSAARSRKFRPSG